MPKISVLMITYNRELFLKKAIDSVLLQKLKDLEIVLVDDGSADNTKVVVDNYISVGAPIKYVKNKVNRGIVESRNLALSLCSGEYIAVLDSDDIWIDNNKLNKQLDFLEKNKQYGVCGSMAKVIDNFDRISGDIALKSSDSAIRRRILLSNQFINSSVLMRRDLLDKIGFYKNYLVGEDYDLFLRIGLVGKFFNFSDKMIAYRKHSGSITKEKRFVASKEHLKIVKKYKGKYPLYFIAVVKSYLRIIFSFIL